MAVPVRILHLDDNPLDAELVRLALEVERKNLPASITYVKTEQAFLAALERKDFDIILSDYRMPEFDGDEALRAARKKCPEIPFIMVTGELGEERAIETLQRGATDYVLKDRIFRLVPAIARALEEARNARKRRDAERGLIEARQQRAETLESIQDAFYGVDSHWRFTYLNYQAELLLGRTSAEILGKSLWETFPQVRGTRAEREVRAVMQDRVPSHFEARSAIKNTWLDIHVFPKADGGIAVLFRDIQERKMAEEIMQQQAALIDLVPNAVIVRTVDGTITFWNRGAEMMYGWTKAEALGRKAHDVLRTQFPVTLPEIMKHLAREEFWEGELVQFTRSLKQIVVRSRWTIQNHATRGTVLLESNVDISERKAQERALRLSEERFTAAFRNSPYPLAVSRIEDGLLLDVNDAFLAQYGGTREELIGQSTVALGLYVNPEDRDRLLERVRSEGAAREVEVRANTRAHGERILQLSVCLLSLSEEQALLTIAHDVTVERQAQGELQQSYRRLFEILESIQDGFYTIDRDWRFVYVNNKAEELWKKPRKALLGKKIREVFPEVEGTGPYQCMEQAMRERRPVHCEGISPVLHRRMSAHIYPTAEGGLSVYFQDLTERNAEEESREDRNEQTPDEPKRKLGSSRL